MKRESIGGRRAGKGALAYVVAAGLLTALACAPSAKTVANVSTGIIGCPAEDLVVFNYAKATRTWAASCNDSLYVCSDGRGGARCTKQDANAVDPERLTRAKALLTLTGQRRAYFVDKNILQGDWDQFAELVATVGALSDKQFESFDPAKVYGGVSEAFNRDLGACLGQHSLTVITDKDGKVGPLRGPGQPAGPCVNALVTSPELDPLTKRPSGTFFLLPGVFGIRPMARPTVAVAAATPSSAPVVAPPPSNPVPAAPASAELDATVRRWLDDNASSILACSGKDSSAVLVNVSADGVPEVALRGATDGPETQCIRHGLSAPAPLPPGPAQILHVVKAPATPPAAK